MGARKGVTAIAALVFAIAGCESIIGAKFDRDLAACDPAAPPAPPPSSAGAGSAGEVVMAFASLEWGEEPPPDGAAPGYDAIGLDLDGKCTSLFDPAPCEPPAWTGQRVPPDGAHGIDNAVGWLLASQSDFFGAQAFTSDFLNKETKSGDYAPLAVVRVRDYNGFYADDQVAVDLVVVKPLGAPPKLDGTDAFLADPIAGPFTDAHAYVSQYQLVARFSPAAIKLANALFRLTDATLVATLKPSADPGGYSFSGLLAGHGSSNDLLVALPALTGSFPGVVQCKSGGFYPKLKEWICGHADSLHGGDPRFAGACDALSFGVKFDGRAVQIAGTAPPPDAGPLCDPSVDPSTDTCSAGAASN